MPAAATRSGRSSSTNYKNINQRKLKPTSVAGIEFDCLIEEEKTYTAEIPTYPVEDGFNISDAIINQPITLKMTLYLTTAPLTWKGEAGHEAGYNHIDKAVSRLEEMWEKKKPVKIVTSDAIYTDMGITSITITKNDELGYAREIAIEAQKIRKAGRKTAKIPSYSLKSGDTQAKAGQVNTSGTPTGGSASSGTSEGSGETTAASSGTNTPVEPSGASYQSSSSSSGSSGSSSVSSGPSSSGGGTSVLRSIANHFSGGG